MLVGEIMTSPAVTVRDDARPRSRCSCWRERRLTMLPVRGRREPAGRRGERGGPAGAAGAARPARPPSPGSSAAAEPGPTTVAELMIGTPQTTSEHADVADVAALFRRTAWKCLPVMRDERLVGVVSRSDIIRAMARDDDDIEDDVNRLLTGPRTRAGRPP